MSNDFSDEDTRPLGPRAQRDRRESRLEAVAGYRAAGLSPEQIATLSGLSRPHIRRDLDGDASGIRSDRGNPVTSEFAIAARESWRRYFGGELPSSYDWHPSKARTLAGERAFRSWLGFRVAGAPDRHHAWPRQHEVLARFTSWAAFLGRPAARHGRRKSSVTLSCPKPCAPTRCDRRGSTCR
jgi:hypothetical protein